MSAQQWVRRVSSPLATAFLMAAAAALAAVGSLGTPTLFASPVFLGGCLLLALNIAVCILRRPLTPSSLPFILVHAGLLLLMAGGFWTYLNGQDGQLRLLEGESAESFLAGGEAVYLLHRGRGEQLILPLSGPSGTRELLLWTGPGRYRLEQDSNECWLRLQTPDLTWQGQVRTLDHPPRELLFPEGTLEVFRAEYRRPLGFRLRLQEFQLREDEGGLGAVEVKSLLRAEDGEQQVDVWVEPNAPLHFAGLCILQSGYEILPDGRRQSVLAVTTTPGEWLVYLGYCLFLAGLIPGLWRRRRMSASLILLALLPLLVLTGCGTPATGWGQFAEEPVQYQGRLMPMESFARDRLQSLAGPARLPDDPLRRLAEILAGDGETVPVLGVHRLRLLQALVGETRSVGLQSLQRVSLRELGGSDAVAALLRSRRGSGNAGEMEALLELATQVRLLRDLPRHCRVLPAKGGVWVSPFADVTGETALVAAAFRDYLSALLRDGDRDLRASRRFRELRAGLTAEPLPGLSLRAELFLQRAALIRRAGQLYLAVCLILLLRAVVRRSWLEAWLEPALILAWGLQSLALGCWILAAGRLPLGTLPEYALLLLWVLMPILAWMGRAGAGSRRRVIAALSGAVGLLILADTPIGRDLAPLMPVLRSRWLHAHVLTVMIGYAAFFAAASVAFWRLLLPAARTAEHSALDEAVERALVVGFFFLSLGIVTGSVWGSYAWGRYWGWDPKETWSAVTWVVYAIPLHLRGHISGRGRAWFAIFGLVCVLFTWFGVSYLLPGLHSYAR